MHRVGIVALLQESNTFLSGATTLEHFRQDGLLTGPAIRERYAGSHHEIGGFFDGLDRAGVEAVPIFAARALPYGAVTAETFAALMEMLREELEAAGTLDGYLVAPHGATVSVNVPDVDGAWLSVVRRHAGPAVPIIGTLDPHANLSPEMVAATDALFAYRTNPHIDQFARGQEAAALMARTLRGEVRPVQAACFPPMAIGIERQCTTELPLKAICDDVERVRGERNVLGASLILGFPYADVAEMGSATLVVTDGDTDLALHDANQLGATLWNRRTDLVGNFFSVPEAVTQALTLPGPVCLLDMGDNVGGGSPGDGTLIAWELHQRRVAKSLVVLFDPLSVQQAEAVGVGQRVTLSVGGKTDDRHGAPLRAEFIVRHTSGGVFEETEVRHGGIARFDQGRTAIVESDTGLTVMLTSRRTPPFSLRQITAFGLDPRDYRVIVAKGVNAPLAAYQPVCPSFVRVNTPGVTTADMTQLTFHHRRRPMWPFERETSWGA
ncbi:MAG: M81 family metallopeptidase [Planctomycetaceae bacterium]|nr:M81 family metallopeptidase [Planctomycetaceae bacterium]